MGREKEGVTKVNKNKFDCQVEFLLEDDSYCVSKPDMHGCWVTVRLNGDEAEKLMDWLSLQSINESSQ